MLASFVGGVFDGEQICVPEGTSFWRVAEAPLNLHRVTEEMLHLGAGDKFVKLKYYLYKRIAADIFWLYRIEE